MLELLLGELTIDCACDFHQCLLWIEVQRIVAAVRVAAGQSRRVELLLLASSVVVTTCLGLAEWTL